MMKLGQIALIGGVALYLAVHFLSLRGSPAETGNGFEFSVAKHRDDAQHSQWSVKMSAGNFDMNLNWKP